jgi:hypothetical protein
VWSDLLYDIELTGRAVLVVDRADGLSSCPDLKERLSRSVTTVVSSLDAARGTADVVIVLVEDLVGPGDIDRLFSRLGANALLIAPFKISDAALGDHLIGTFHLTGIATGYSFGFGGFFGRDAEMRYICGDRNVQWMRITRRKPYAFLLLERAQSGKTTLSAELHTRAGLPVVHGDTLINRICLDDAGVPVASAVQAIVREGDRRRDYMYTIVGLFEGRHVYAMLDDMPFVKDRASFVLDMFVPGRFHDALVEHLDRLGYIPVHCVAGRSDAAVLAAARREAAMEIETARQQAAAQVAATQAELHRLLASTPYRIGRFLVSLGGLRRPADD